MATQVPPTRMNLGVFKDKHKGAKKGYELLKNKSDALKVRFRDICKLIHATKVGMADSSSVAFFSLTQAEYAAGNFRNKLLEGNMSASVRVTSRTDNVAGVKLPVFNQYDTGAEAGENYGLAGGGRKIQACREKFGEYLKALVKVASLQTSFIAMDEALKVTNRRVNALENVTLPKIDEVIKHIERELDELEREDFTRLKMVKKKKEEAIKAAEVAEKERAVAAKQKIAAAASASQSAANSPTKQQRTVASDASLSPQKSTIPPYVAPLKEFSDTQDDRSSSSINSSGSSSNSNSNALPPPPAKEETNKVSGTDNDVKKSVQKKKKKKDATATGSQEGKNLLSAYDADESDVVFK